MVNVTKAKLGTMHIIKLLWDGARLLVPTFGWKLNIYLTGYFIVIIIIIIIMIIIITIIIIIIVI